MAASETIQVRIDHNTKEQAIEILGKLHLNMSEAIKIFLGQVVLRKGLPFEVWMPTPETARIIAEVDAGKGLHAVADESELMKELNS